VHESIVPSFFRPACIAHTITVLLHGDWAIFNPHPTPRFHAIHHTILCIAISCKGYLGRAHGPLRRTTARWPMQIVASGSGQSGPRRAHHCLAFTIYSFTPRLLCTHQPSFPSPRRPALPALMQYYCTTIDSTRLPFRPPVCMLHTIQYW